MSRPPRESQPPSSALFPGGTRPSRTQPPPVLTTSDSFFLPPSSSDELDLSLSHHSSSPPSSSSNHNHTSSSTNHGVSLSPPPPPPPHLPRVQFHHAPSSSSTVPQPFSPSESSRLNLLTNTNSIDSSLPHSQPLQPSTNINTNTGFQRKKSLVRPDRERIDENHRLYNYRAHAALMQAEGRGVAGVSRTGHYAQAGLPFTPPLPSTGTSTAAGGGGASSAGLRRGKSILAREEGMVANESGLSMFKRGATIRRPTLKKKNSGEKQRVTAHYNGGQGGVKKEPVGPWMMFCLALTVCFPSPLLKCFGLRTKERQSAWREKIGFLAVIMLGMTAVGFLTFGFTKSVCGTPALRYHTGTIGTGSMIFHGYNYDLDKFQHPSAAGIEGGTNPLYDLFDAASKDGSFLFQTVNNNCKGVITAAPGTGIKVNTTSKDLGWYFPCNLYDQWGTSTVNLTGYAEGVLCHTQDDARNQFKALKPLGQVYFTWEDLKNSTRNLGVYDGAVLDFSLLKWLSPTQVSYPPLFDEIKTGNATFRGRDITSLMVASKQQKVAQCLVDTIRVGFIDSVTIGCVASDVVLYVSLVVIIGVVVLRFAMAVFFGWFWSWRIGKFPNETYAQRMARSAEIEHWTDDIYRPAPARYRPNAVKYQKKTMWPTTSRFTKLGGDAGSTVGGGGNKYGEFRKGSGGNTPPNGGKAMLGAGMRNSPPGSPGFGKPSRSSSSLPLSTFNFEGQQPSRSSSADGMMGACPFPLIDVIPQPPPDFEPFNYPLVHTFLLVTAYSESIEGLRTTLDSLATTDYPNSHKVILVIADGMVKGSGNALTTPEIVLGMMKELVVQSDDVDAHSYVAIADGHKRHNKAKVYAGFYSYDNNTVEASKQQRVPMLLIAKVGNDQEIGEAKPGNRGKRDSQIILMSFLQKVMFDERMSSFEYEFFNSLWRCTGVSPDRYETVLCVDADTKVFPDSVSRMVSCMVHDPEIMGLCGETKVANKSETWVTMMQVFEYYSAHHLSKAFESVFGGVTCLPGCFSMYRIKAPKGGDGYWVPILANPDIVEHYSENVVDTLHKKNLLLLGEDRYLTTLMLRTFPRRKMMFCPQAVCKTVVPDTFGVLLSQRRRWINSTVHNLLELIVVPDLCGVFCFSMRFVIFMELVGTLVLPAAISFTIYLIIVAVIPGTTKPIISLILLGIILGIPGLLIVLTSRKVSYLGWMLVYLLSLPIWNFVLPSYAFLHMDDFTWGQTRKVVGDTGQGHTDKDGDFDSSHIVMKRWAEFERDRRYRSGNHSRDSAYDMVHRSHSPQRTTSNRFSTVSSADTFVSGTGGSGASEAIFRRGSPGYSNSHSHSHSTSEGYSGPRLPQQLELPAPLATQGSSPGSSTGSIPHYDSLPELPPKAFEDAYTPSIDSPSGLGPHGGMDYPRYSEAGYDSDEVEPILRDSPQLFSRGSMDAPMYPAQTYDRQGRESPVYFSEPEVLASLPASSNLPGMRAGRPVSASPGYDRSDSVSSRSSGPPLAGTGAHHRRGVSLVDDGPVPGSQGFRVVQRQRRTSQGPAQPARSRTSNATDFSQSPIMESSPTSPTIPSALPAGAAPPRPPSNSYY